MRILYWESSFWPRLGGAEVFGMALVRGLRARGHTLQVIASHWPGKSRMPDLMDFEGTPVHRLPMVEALQQHDPLALATVRRQVAACVRDFAPEVCHVNSQDITAYFLGALGRCPSVVTVHSSATFRLGADSLMGRLLTSAAAVVGVSRAMSDDARALRPEIAPRLVTLLNALPPPAAGESAPVDPNRLLAAGRLVVEKGFDVLLAALARLRPRWPALRLVLLGDGPVRGALEAQAAALGLADAVEFRGWVAPERVHAEMQQSALIVMPSVWREPFGLVALQAAQAGRPLVASATGGIPEIVAPEQTGLLVPPGDADALAGAIERLLQDPARAAAMGAAASLHARTQFDFDRFVTRYETLLATVAAGGALPVADGALWP
ncbi:MAG: glycosyltransferase family 4 protein [Xanthomonadales bacterium]|jgi:glycogen(starch) synthase|nr:glycosyltransferase family 4 protein [Xanthomonadales bacterium]